MNLRNTLVLMLDILLIAIGVYALCNIASDIQLLFGILFVYLGFRALLTDIVIR